jgi:hypothetical protein
MKMNVTGVGGAWAGLTAGRAGGAQGELGRTIRMVLERIEAAGGLGEAIRARRAAAAAPGAAASGGRGPAAPPERAPPAVAAQKPAAAPAAAARGSVAPDPVPVASAASVVAARIVTDGAAAEAPASRASAVAERATGSVAERAGEGEGGLRRRWLRVPRETWVSEGASSLRRPASEIVEEADAARAAAEAQQASAGRRALAEGLAVPPEAAARIGYCAGQAAGAAPEVPALEQVA